MTEPLQDVWTPRDYPVLREITQRFDSGSEHVGDYEIAAALGVQVQTARLACRALERRELLTTSETYDQDVTVDTVSGQAYLITGLHPDGEGAIEQLVSLLRQASDQAPDDEERTRLRRAASALSDASGKVWPAP